MNEHLFMRRLSDLREALPDDAARAGFDEQFLSRRKTPVILYGLSYWLGALGIDRFVLGHWGLGLGKLFVAGILPFYADISQTGYDSNPAIDLLQLGAIWQLVDWFLIGGATRKSNMALAEEIAGTVAIGGKSD